MHWHHWWYSQYHKMSKPVPIVSHDVWSCFTSFQLSWPKECNDSIDDAIGITWCWYWCWWHQMAKSPFASRLDYIDLRNAILPLAALLAYDQTSHTALNIDHLGLRNAMMPLMIPSTSHVADTSVWNYMTPTPMPMTSCDSNADVNGITWKKLVFHHISIVVI